mmetsp:Transcript_14624/g.24358  ORF Transcript_14624/g.24358 Transcript_14624/m.24358 type:complete len:509 (-) Transcript_14624:102-1628(-)
MDDDEQLRLAIALSLSSLTHEELEPTNVMEVCYATSPAAPPSDEFLARTLQEQYDVSTQVARDEEIARRLDAEAKQQPPRNPPKQPAQRPAQQVAQQVAMTGSSRQTAVERAWVIEMERAEAATRAARHNLITTSKALPAQIVGQSRQNLEASSTSAPMSLLERGERLRNHKDLDGSAKLMGGWNGQSDKNENARDAFLEGWRENEEYAREDSREDEITREDAEYARALQLELDEAYAHQLAAQQLSPLRGGSASSAVSSTMGRVLSEAGRSSDHVGDKQRVAEEIQRNIFTSPTTGAASRTVSGVSYALVTGSQHDNGTLASAKHVAGGCATEVGRTAPSNNPNPVPRPALPRATLKLVLDGANIAFSHGEANQVRQFSARGIWLCVEFWRRKRAVPLQAISVTLNRRHYNETDIELMRLQEMGVIGWTPLGKDDDLYTISTADEAGAWVVTNDRYENYRRWTAQVRLRLITFYFAGGGAGAKDIFSPNPEEAERFAVACGISSRRH